MGLMKKIRTRCSVHKERPKKPTSDETTPQAAEVEKYETSAFYVVSIPKEYSQESPRSFNWLTNEMDSFEVTPCSTIYDSQTENVEALKPYDDTPRLASSMGWREWLFPCFGHSQLPDNSHDPTATETSYGGTGSSSEPSCSREGKMLAVPAVNDDVSDMTSTPSIDSSGSDSNDETSDHGDRPPAKSMVGFDVTRNDQLDGGSQSSSEL